MEIKRLNKGFLGIVALMLAACGGGGGSGGGSTPPPSGATLGGTAAKGIIKSGNVVAEELDASGSVIAQVGSATTGADGSYSLTLSSNYSGGPIQVKITADANTEMKCDAPAGCGDRTDGISDTNATVDFGEWYKPGSLTMKALVAEASANDTIGVNITPYTDLAARGAIATGSIDAAAVYNANSEVSNLLGGLDILNTKPLDITDVASIGSGSATEVAYAAFSAAIAAIADTSSGSPDIDGALNALETSFSGGMIAAADLQEIIDGASSALSKTSTGDTSGTLVSLQDDVNNAGAGGTVDPEPSPGAGDATLAKVKAFVADVRTWGTVIESEIGTQGDAFGLQVDLASTAVDANMDFLVGPALEAAIDAAMQKISGEPSTDLSSYETGLPPDSLYPGFPGDPQFSAGNIIKSGGVVTISGGLVNGVTVNMSLQFPDDATLFVAGSSMTIGITSASVASTDTDVDINSGTITFNLASDYTVDYTALDLGTAAEPVISGGSINLDISLTQRKGLDWLTGDVALDSAITFAGMLSATLTNPVMDSVTGHITWITPSNLTLAGNISDTAGNSLDADFTVNITNADSFTPVGELPFGTSKAGIVTWAYSDTSPVDGTDDTFILTSPEYTLTIQWDSGTGSAAVTENWGGGYVFNSSLSGPFVSIIDAVSSGSSPLNWSKPYYVWVDSEGGYSVDYTGANFGADGAAAGSLVDPEYVIEDSSHWLAGTVGLNFTLQLAGLPEASVNINGTRTDFEAGNATITIAYDSRQIVIAGDFVGATATIPATATGSVTITNQDGVTMVIDGLSDTSTSGDIKFNGTTYGTMTEMSNGLTKITYTDGTFETL